MHAHTHPAPICQTVFTRQGEHKLEKDCCLVAKTPQSHGGVSFSTVFALSKLINSLLWLQLNTSAKNTAKMLNFAPLPHNYTCSVTSQTLISQPVQLSKKKKYTFIVNTK